MLFADELGLVDEIASCISVASEDVNLTPAQEASISPDATCIELAGR